MEKVLRKIVENYLFVKSEKYVWNVKKVRFSEVMIGPDGVKKKKKKVQVVED